MGCLPAHLLYPSQQVAYLVLASAGLRVMGCLPVQGKAWEMVSFMLSAVPHWQTWVVLVDSFREPGAGGAAGLPVRGRVG